MQIYIFIALETIFRYIIYVFLTAISKAGAVLRITFQELFTQRRNSYRIDF